MASEQQLCCCLMSRCRSRRSNGNSNKDILHSNLYPNFNLNWITTHFQILNPHAATFSKSWRELLNLDAICYSWDMWSFQGGTRKEKREKKKQHINYVMAQLGKGELNELLTIHPFLQCLSSWGRWGELKPIPALGERRGTHLDWSADNHGHRVHRPGVYMSVKRQTEP